MWLYNDSELKLEDIPEKAIGFIYRINNITNGKWYLGRKLLTKAATKTVNGKKKKIRKPSDWESYWSSSPYLIDVIEKEGKENFTREILMFVDSKSSLLFAEEYILFVSGSMFTEQCYNGNIRSRIQKSWFKKTPTLFEDLKKIKI